MSSKPNTSSFKLGLTGQCPNCQNATIFKNILEVSDACKSCGTDFSQIDNGDGPASFSILIIGTIACILAVVMESMYQPSYLHHAAILIPFVIVTSIISLRFAKSLLLAIQHKHNILEK